MGVHATALVENGARLGRDVTVGPFAFVDRDVEIGDGTAIGPHCVIMKNVRLGEGCRVHTGAVIGDEPQDLSYGGATTYVRVGARCVIREYVTIHRGTAEGTATEIGNDCFLMALSHFAHNVRLGDRVIVANGAVLGGYVEVGERAFISGNCSVHQFVRIGKLVMMSGNSGVSKDVPPFCTVRGAMANRISGLNVVGMRRADMKPEERKQVRQAFKLLYNSGLNVSQALPRITQECHGAAIREFTEFIAASKRGICGFMAED